MCCSGQHQSLRTDVFKRHYISVYTSTFWARHGLRLERCHFFSARHDTALHVYTFCRDSLKVGTGANTGAILTAHIDFFHGTARHTCVKAGTARLIGVPRPTYLVVLGTAKNLHRLHCQNLPCRAEKKQHPYQNISRAQNVL